jgi:hypothetical protein
MKIDSGNIPPEGIRHGWRTSSEGIPILWMPLLQWLSNGHHGYTRSRALLDQWERLTFTLRDISHFRRVLIQNCKDEGGDCNKFHQAELQLPRDAEVAFHLCKRIVAATIEALSARGSFTNDDSLSTQTRKFLKNIADVRMADGINVPGFIGAWKRLDDWYWDLADPDGVKTDSQKGIRDLLEHRNVILQVSCGASDDQWYCDLVVFNSKQEVLKSGVLECLQKTVHGLCRLYDGIRDSIDATAWNSDNKICENGYWILPFGYCLHVTGEYCDYIYFWPEFGAANVITKNTSQIRMVGSRAQQGDAPEPLSRPADL